MRFARSCDSDFTDADEDLDLQYVTYGIQISPSEYVTQKEDVETSDTSTTPGHSKLVSVDDETSMNGTSDVSEVSVNGFS